MNKYWALYKINFQKTIAYRASTLLGSLGDFIDTFVFMFVWLIIFGEKQAIGGFTLSETITYLLGIGIIASIARSWIQYELPADVKSGNLSGYMTKPFSYPIMRAITDLAERPLEIILRIITYLTIGFLLKGTFIINTDIGILLLFIISIAFAFLISYLIGFIFGCYTFWMTENAGLVNTYWSIAMVFSGGYAPLTFFPHWFQVIANVLPFSYTRYFPMLIYLKKISGLEILKGISLQVIWIILLYFIARFLWRKGIKRYEGVGI